jgi:hypothetical protein
MRNPVSTIFDGITKTVILGDALETGCPISNNCLALDADSSDAFSKPAHRTPWDGPLFERGLGPRGRRDRSGTFPEPRDSN